MKVLLVSSSSGSRGGGEIYLYYLAAGLARLGHHVVALCSDRPRMDELALHLAKCAEVRRIALLHTYDRFARSLGAAIDARGQKRYRDVLRSIAPDVVHINQQVAEDGLDLLLAARSSGIPFLSTIHIAYSAGLLGARFGGVRDAVAGNILRRIGGTHIVVANRARQDLLRRFGFMRADQVAVVLNGVLAPPSSAARDATRTRWQAAGAEVVIGSVGRLESQKAPDFGLHIVARLLKQGLPIRYVWIGDGPLRREFEALARQLGIADRVRIDGWQSDISGCLQALDLLLMPSRFEGLPLALLEAMCAGLCCCVSDVDGMAEAIEPGKTGYLCPLGDLDAWVRQITVLVTDPSLRAEVGARVRDIARTRFSADRMAADTVKVYRQAIDAGEATHAGQTA
jgi:glycosyltransferase involved in cell wall biosynthesis